MLYFHSIVTCKSFNFCPLCLYQKSTKSKQNDNCCSISDAHKCSNSQTLSSSFEIIKTASQIGTSFDPTSPYQASLCGAYRFCNTFSLSKTNQSFENHALLFFSSSSQFEYLNKIRRACSRGFKQESSPHKYFVIKNG